MKSATLMIGLLALLHGCAPSRAKEPELSLGVSEAGQMCRVSLQGASFEIPADQERLEAALRALAKRRSTVVIEPRGDHVGYRCLGSVILLAQKAGIHKVGFVAEPPPVAAQ